MGRHIMGRLFPAGWKHHIAAEKSFHTAQGQAHDTPKTRMTDAWKIVVPDENLAH